VMRDFFTFHAANHMKQPDISPLRLHLGLKTDPIENRYSYEWLFRLLAEEDVVVGAGSACSAESGKTSRVLAAGCKALGFDIVIAGKQAIDGDTAQVGPGVAMLPGMMPTLASPGVSRPGQFGPTRRAPLMSR